MKNASMFAGWLALCVACGSDPTAPATSLVGTWDIIGFTDDGVAANTTGTGEFRANGTFSARGTIAFPDEPVEMLEVDGNYIHTGTVVSLTAANVTTEWTLSLNGDQVTLTENEPAPANTVTLRLR